MIRSYLSISVGLESKHVVKLLGFFENFLKIRVVENKHAENKVVEITSGFRIFNCICIYFFINIFQLKKSSVLDKQFVLRNQVKKMP